MSGAEEPDQAGSRGERSAGRPEDVAFAAGLTEFFRARAIVVHEVTPGEAGRYTVFLEGERVTELIRVVELLAEIPQLVAYRHHPTSAAVLELYAVEADVPGGARGLHRLRDGERSRANETGSAENQS